MILSIEKIVELAVSTVLGSFQLLSYRWMSKYLIVSILCGFKLCLADVIPNELDDIHNVLHLISKCLIWCFFVLCMIYRERYNFEITLAKKRLENNSDINIRWYFTDVSRAFCVVWVLPSNLATINRKEAIEKWRISIKIWLVVGCSKKWKVLTLPLSCKIYDEFIKAIIKP